MMSLAIDTDLTAVVCLKDDKQVYRIRDYRDPDDVLLENTVTHDLIWRERSCIDVYWTHILQQIEALARVASGL